MLKSIKVYFKYADGTLGMTLTRAVDYDQAQLLTHEALLAEGILINPPLLAIIK